MTDSDFDNIVQLFKWYHYPKDNGMVDTSLLIRKHNDEKCIAAMNKIWNLVGRFTNHDELFFNLAMWILKCNYMTVPINLLLKSNLTLKEEAL